MKRYAVSILYQEQKYSHMTNMLRMGIVEAVSQDEARGKFQRMKDADADLKNATIAITLVIEIKDQTAPATDTGK